MPRRTYSPNRNKAIRAIEALPELPEHQRLQAAAVAVTFALLEVAFQVGRVADNVPLWGPPEEQ